MPHRNASYVLLWDAREPSILIDPSGDVRGARIAVPEISWWEMPDTGAVPVLFTRADAEQQEREDREERPDDDPQAIVRVEVLGDPAAPETVYRFEDGREFTLALLRQAAGQA